jgi:hypothetical protein
MFSNNIKLNAKHVVKPYQTIIQTQCKTLGKLIYILKQKTKTIHTLCGIRGHAYVFDAEASYAGSISQLRTKSYFPMKRIIAKKYK